MLFSRQRTLPFSQQSLTQALDVQTAPQASARVRRSPAVARAEAPAPAPESVVVQKVSAVQRSGDGLKVRPGQRVTAAELARGVAAVAQPMRLVGGEQTDPNTSRATSLLPSSAGSVARLSAGCKPRSSNVLGAAAPKVLRLDTGVRHGGRAPSAVAPVLSLAKAAPKVSAKPAVAVGADDTIRGGEQTAPLSTRKRIEQAAELFGACMLIAAALLLTLFG
ncbi:MAG: hypothetical protein RL398_3197 [Planctomycetota bacterium]